MPAEGRVATLVKEKRRLLRIPSRVVLPFGYRITVRQLSDSEMDKRDENADGIWDDDTKTIFIRRRLPVTRRRYILAHELGHAWLDWQHRYLDDGKAST
jgi:Zn-dependent peptidase ImmA (M78 family)